MHKYYRYFAHYCIISLAALCHRLYKSYTSPELSKKGYQILKNVYEMNRMNRQHDKLLLNGLWQQMIEWKISIQIYK